MAKKKQRGPKILLLDIETSPILGYVWSLWQQDVGLNQINKDWFILSWAAKWLNGKKMMYADQRDAPDIENDKKLLQPLWELIDEADILISQNGIQFDIKKLNARFIAHGMKPPSSYRHIDTKILAKRHFAFTSNKLEYMAEKLQLKNTKSKHQRFVGFELWREVLKGNKAAWKEMEKYNKQDVLALEELYLKLSPWDTKVNLSVYSSLEHHICQCGHPAFVKYGYGYSNVGKFQRYKCKQCGAEYKDRKNLLSKEKRRSLKVGR